MLELLVALQLSVIEPAPAPRPAATPRVETPQGARVGGDTDIDQIVCMNVVRTGSRLPVRRCLTRRDQEQVRGDSRDRLRDQIRSTLTINPPGG